MLEYSMTTHQGSKLFNRCINLVEPPQAPGTNEHMGKEEKNFLVKGWESFGGGRDQVTLTSAGVWKNLDQGQ